MPRARFESTGDSCCSRWRQVIPWPLPTRSIRCGIFTFTYTRDYWERFCGDTLGTPVHHSPSRGGGAESRKFGQWYENTLQSYQRLFGEVPPPDLWPDSTFRSRGDLHFKRVNVGYHWVVPKPRVPLGFWIGGLAVASVGVAALMRDRGHIVGDTAQFEFVGESLFGVGLWVVVGLLFILSFIRERRCPNCSRFWVFRSSGFSDESGRYSRDDWECDECGHREWKGRSGGGGGCGWGGDGGCGGD